MKAAHLDEKSDTVCAQSVRDLLLIGVVSIASCLLKSNGSHLGLSGSSMVDWAGWKFRVNYDVSLYAPSSFTTLILISLVHALKWQCHDNR